MGWEDRAPFTRIIVTAAGPKIPLPLIEQLSEKGKMVIPVGERYMQELIRAEKVNGKILQKSFGHCTFVPLVGKYGMS
jgi:protein-L-isoaspartate(D-aspartate) O-methyltransferase